MRMYPYSPLSFFSALWFFSLSLLSSAQTVDYPNLPKSGARLEQFIPDGWHLLDSASGDLNNDKINDLALVLESDLTEGREEEADDLSEEQGSEGETTEEDEEYLPEGKVRILAVLFGGKKGDYRLSVQANSAILGSLDGGVFGDPWSEISVDVGTLRFSFYGGSSWRWGLDYQFRYQKGGWVLIGATTMNYGSTSGQMESYDFNLLTGDVEITTGNMFGVECIDCDDCSNCQTCDDCGECRRCVEVEDTVVRKNIGKKPLHGLEDFTPMSWEIMPGEYI